MFGFACLFVSLLFLFLYSVSEFVLYCFVIEIGIVCVAGK